MPAGQLKINNKDAYTTWGVSLDNQALSALLTPAAQKDVITNATRLEHGKRIINTAPKKADRDITLTLNLIARDENDFFAKYASFCNELALGTLNIKTSFQPSVVYKCIYISCNQFSQFNRGLAKFSLRVNEPNPNDRE